MVKLFFEVTIYPKDYVISEQNVGFVIIVSRYKGKWIFVQHKARDTRELPGGHKEEGEKILEGAQRELFEETGATKYELEIVGYRSLVDDKGIKTFGAIFFAEIDELGKMPNSEIARRDFFDKIPENMTYPNVHPIVYEMAIKQKLAT